MDLSDCVSLFPTIRHSVISCSDSACCDLSFSITQVSMVLYFLLHSWVQKFPQWGHSSPMPPPPAFYSCYKTFTQWQLRASLLSTLSNAIIPWLGSLLWTQQDLGACCFSVTSPSFQPFKHVQNLMQDCYFFTHPSNFTNICWAYSESGTCASYWDRMGNKTTHFSFPLWSL